MKIIKDIYDYTPVPCAATIGSFDGVHMGHRAMLAELRASASEKGLPLMVVTFARHPRLLFNREAEPFLLSGIEEKIQLLEAEGVDILAVLNFDSAMASMCAERFMSEILAARLGVRLLAVGYDHRFGKPCAGEGIDEYISYGSKCGVEVFKASPYTVEGTDVSSSAVRRSLQSGDVETAARLLGRRYSVCGKVVHCAGIGRRLGFPTANISLADEMRLMPANGVYEVETVVGGVHYRGVMNIGVKPTVNNSGERTAEVHIIDFSGDIYGSMLCVGFVRRLRGERTFGSLDELRAQIEKDVEQVKDNV